ncbi:hypothetical protein BUE80_DR009929 [Diplocarpon rosae]|nr:hypothetical protein BUE80_DR009929 [Diplocarpon rosae]
MWDQAGFPSTLLDPDATLFDFERDVIRSVPRSTKRRFFRYLSLFSKDEYTRGLSVYFSGHGIVGLEVHFSRVSKLSGYREGCELHLSLCPGERIARVWLRTVNSPSTAFAAPALVIETTRRNLYTFGSYILPSMVVDNGYKWILLRHEGCVTGFYYENVKFGKTIMRLGVTGDGTALGAAPLQPQYHQCGFPSPQIGSPNAGLFISIAVLHGLERVDMCRVKNRCTGLMIHYYGSRTSVLGQWHASCASQSSCIYDSNSPAATDIHFKISSHKDRQIVTGVSFTPFMTEVDPDSTYHVFSVTEHIVWWFSRLYDEISRWTGELQAIPDQSIMKQSM